MRLRGTSFFYHRLIMARSQTGALGAITPSAGLIAPSSALICTLCNNFITDGAKRSARGCNDSRRGCNCTIGVARVLRLGGQMSTYANVPPVKNWKLIGFGPLFFGRGPKYEFEKCMLGRAQDWKILKGPQLHWGPTRVTPSTTSTTPSFFVIVRPKNVRRSVGACKTSEQIL